MMESSQTGKSHFQADRIARTKALSATKLALFTKIETIKNHRTLEAWGGGGLFLNHEVYSFR